MATESLPVGAMSPHDLLLRAAVLSVFDVDWIYGRLVDAEVDDVVNFLSSSCERIVDSTGTPRWQLRDECGHLNWPRLAWFSSRISAPPGW
jgi:hypothetical protein